MKKNKFIKQLLGAVNTHTGITIEKDEFDTNLIDLGIDSVFAIEIANDLESILNIIIDDRDIIHFTTINKILNHFKSHLND